MGMQSCQPLRFGRSLLYPRALHYAATLMIISLRSPSGKLKLFIFNPMRCVWASNSPATGCTRTFLCLRCWLPVGIRVLTSWPMVVFGSIPALMHHFLVRGPLFSIISNRHAEARSWKWAPGWWISSKENAHQNFWEEITILMQYDQRRAPSMRSAARASSVLGTFCCPWHWTVRQLEVSHQQRKSDMKYAEDFPLIFMDCETPSSQHLDVIWAETLFTNFFCSAQHRCLSSWSWQLFWCMFLQMRIAKEDHYIYMLHWKSNYYA